MIYGAEDGQVILALSEQERNQAPRKRYDLEERESYEKSTKIPEAKLKRINLDDVIESGTFTSTGEELGYGCWGSVASYTDPVGQRWALKRFSPNPIALEQMKQRNLTEEDVMRKEAIPLSAAQHHLAPRIIERDKKGKLFVGMPLYLENLEEKIRCRPLSIDDAIKVTTEVADAAFYLHGLLNRAHGDIKPKNIMFDENNKLFLTDLGSSTCISISDMSEDPRDKIGDMNYRAPEGFKGDSHPSARSDVFSIGALLYKIVTGEGIYKGLTDLENLKEKDYNKHLKQKLKKLPRSLRKLTKKCLEHNALKRFWNGEELKKGLEELTQNLSAWDQTKRHMKKWALPFGFSTFGLGALLYGCQLCAPHYSTEVIPIKQNIQGPLTIGLDENGNQIKIDFEREIKTLPKVSHAISYGVEKLARKYSKDRSTAYLLIKYREAHGDLPGGAWRGWVEFNTSYQQDLFDKTATEKELMMVKNNSESNFLIAANSIYDALEESKKETGVIDLEDAMVISRLGKDKLYEAKRAARSDNFSQYITATNSLGKDIIPRIEQEFLGRWVSYVHDDL